MKRQTAVKIVVDVAMTAALLLLMAFELIGRQAHEWIGTGMIVLFVVHHILNRTPAEGKVHACPRLSDSARVPRPYLYPLVRGERHCHVQVRV